MLLQQLVAFLWICCIAAESNGFAHDAAEKPTESGERWSASPLGRMRPAAQRKLLQSAEESTCGNSLEDCNRLNEELYDAALDGESNTVQELISKGADVSSTHGDLEFTPLHAAADAGHVDIVEMLIEAGADINAQNEQVVTALYFAAQEGHLDVAEVLVGAGNLVEREAPSMHFKKWTLEYATNNFVEPSEIQQNMACLKVDDGDIPLGVTALDDHVEDLRIGILCFNWEDCRFLLGANVDAADFRDVTPLHAAAYAGNRNIVQLFLDNEAEIDARDDTGETPSLTAAMYGSGEALEALKKAGADLSIKDNAGNKIEDSICLCLEAMFAAFPEWGPCREGTCGEGEVERIKAILKG